MTGQLRLFDQTPKPDKPQNNPVQELQVIALNKDQPGAKLPDLVPAGALLALNRGYGARPVHVGRILGLLLEQKETSQAITRDEIAEKLSMTWASMQGTINVMRKSELVDSQTRITSFGELVLSSSPYLDNSGLLWLLHYLLGSNALLVLWSNLFNLVLLDHEEITIQQASEAFRILEGRWSAKTIHEKTRHELGGIFKTYTEDLLEPLKIVAKSDVGIYHSFWDTVTIPALIWLSAVLIYRDRYYPGSSALEIPLIARAHYSPGRILRQNEASVRQALDTLHNAGVLTVETRSGLDQVRFKREHTWLSAAAQHLRGETVT
jgi:hypothetical protein